MIKVLVLFTCFNRCNASLNAIKKIKSNRKFKLQFIVVDGGSNDDTIYQIKKENNVEIIYGIGNLYYTEGMRIAIETAKSKYSDYDYVLLINDDVDFYYDVIEKMIEQSISQNNAVIVGACEDGDGHLTYSAIKYTNGHKYVRLTIDDYEKDADSFNANCVLIPRDVFLSVDNMDSVYKHSLGDFDYGLSIRNNGFKIHCTNFFVGICRRNDITNTWQDVNLPISRRLKLKEEPKGMPFKETFHYFRKNFGSTYAVLASIKIYVKIIRKR